MLRRMHRSILLGQTETKLDYVSERNTAKFTEQCSQTRVFELRLGEVHSPCPFSESPAPHSSKQTDNQRYVLLVRTDSEKHVEFDLKRRLLAVITHEMEEGEFISKAGPDKELEATRRKFKLDEQTLSRIAGMFARRPEAKRRRHDAAIQKWSIRSCEEEKQA